MFSIIPSLNLRAGRPINVHTLRSSRNNPLATALFWVHSGFRHLQLIDFDGQVPQTSTALALLMGIKPLNIEIQIGGGIHTQSQAKSYLAAGANQIILSHVLYQPEALKTFVGTFTADKLHLHVNLHQLQSSELLQTRLQYARTLGIRRLTVNNSRSWTPQHFSLLDDYRNQSWEIFAAGNINDIHTIEHCVKRHLSGVVIGKALLNGEIPLNDVLAFAN